MSGPLDVSRKFERAGGTFVTGAEEFAGKLGRIRALVFDWDGVFNRGEKSAVSSSGFNEADSMGVNMLRFGLWLRDGSVPVASIVTGEANPSSELFAARERFHWLFQGVRDKRCAISRICDEHELTTEQVACVYDDINDLAMAESCGLSILVRRRASVLLTERIVESRACDYITASASGEYAVREASELMLGMLGVFDSVVSARSANDEQYRAYFSMRQATELKKVNLAESNSFAGAQ